MIKRTSRNWIPFWGDKWLFGSMRQEFDVAERGIWWDLMSIAMKDEGFIRANKDTPYPTQQLAGMLIIPEDLLERTIEKFIEKGKYTRLKNGTLYIVNWNKYCFTDRHMRRLEEETEGNEEQPDQEDIFRKISIKCPPEFSEMAMAKGSVRMSRLVVAVILGRPLTPEEEVHHRDKDEKNNYPNNLMLFANHTDHGKYEWGENIKPIWDGSKEEIEMSELSATMTRISATSNRLEKSRLDKNREEKKEPLTFTEEPKIEQELKTVKGLGPTKRKMIRDYLKKLSLEFPDVDVLYEIKKKVAWWLDHPLTKKSNIHLQLRNWFIISQKGFNEAKKQHRVGAESRGEKPKYPTSFLNSIYSTLQKQGKKSADYSKRIFDIDYYQAQQLAKKYKDSPAEFIKFLEGKK